MNESKSRADEFGPRLNHRARLLTDLQKVGVLHDATRLALPIRIGHVWDYPIRKPPPVPAPPRSRSPSPPRRSTHHFVITDAEQTDQSKEDPCLSTDTPAVDTALNATVAPIIACDSIPASTTSEANDAVQWSFQAAVTPYSKERRAHAEAKLIELNKAADSENDIETQRENDIETQKPKKLLTEENAILAVATANADPEIDADGVKSERDPKSGSELHASLGTSYKVFTPLIVDSDDEGYYPILDTADLSPRSSARCCSLCPIL
jgi:hypothetical protein